MRENKIITDIEQLTPEWLTRILKNKGYFNQGKVTKIIKKRSQETITSNVHFLELNFSNDAQTEPSSSEIVVKIPKSNDVSRFVGKHEAKFYRIVAEMMSEMPIPICYDAAFSEETGFSHIILENLSKTHVENFEYPPSKRNNERAIDCLAELHAFWWDHPMLKELSKNSYVLYTFKENSFNKEEIFKWFNNQKMTLKPFLEILGERIGNKSKELFKTIFSLYPQVAYERIAKENITVIHCDAHFGNFFYPKDIIDQKYKTILPDWQNWSIGVGGQDLAYMIGLSFFPDYRHLMEKDLIKRYHNKLLKSGVKNYSWDECWYDYKLFTILNIYRIIWWWSIGIPSIVWWPQLEASINTIKDLNCMELLES
ncbi:MAG: oxidoreductase family protein [Promethearchaeota archaeon]